MSCVPAISGTRPHLLSMRPNRVPGATYRRSAPSASWKTAAECDAVNRGDHRDGHLSPDPDDVLDIIGNAVSAFGEIGEGQKAARRWVMRGDPLDVEPGAKGSAFAGQHHRTNAAILLEPGARCRRWP